MTYEIEHRRKLKMIRALVNNEPYIESDEERENRRQEYFEPVPIYSSELRLSMENNIKRFIRSWDSEMIEVAKVKPKVKDTIPNLNFREYPNKS